MRKWIDLVTEDHHDDITSGYNRYVARFRDHQYDPDTTDDDMLTPEKFQECAYEIAHHLRISPLYRGMLLNSLDTLMTGHLGIFWSEDRHIAEGFSHAGSVYDERFTDIRTQNGPELNVIIEIAPVHIEQVDIVETVAVNIHGGESEINLKPNQPLVIRNVWVKRRSADSFLDGPWNTSTFTKLTDHPLLGMTRPS